MASTPTDPFVVETPENIRFGYDVADIGSRFLAILIDSLIQGVMYVILFIGMALVASQMTNLELPDWLAQGTAVILLLIIFLIQFGYFLFLEIFMTGATPGKRLFHLRVIKDNGYPLAPMDSIIRNLIRIIDFFPFAYGVGVITMFSNKRAKRLGDYAASTIVVKMRDDVQLKNLTPTRAVAPQALSSVTLNVRRLEESDIALAETFLNRRAQLSDPNPMTLQIAQRLGNKMELSEAEIPVKPDAALLFIRDTVNVYRAPR